MSVVTDYKLVYEIPSWAGTVNFFTPLSRSSFVHSPSYPVGNGPFFFFVSRIRRMDDGASYLPKPSVDAGLYAQTPISLQDAENDGAHGH